jgi:hypothetical protein
LQNSRAPKIFYNYLIILLLKKAWNVSMAPVHGVYGISLNEGRPSSDQRPGLNEPKGYPTLLILAVGFDLDRASASSPSVQLRRDRAPGGAMAASLRELNLQLCDTKLLSDSSYAI